MMLQAGPADTLDFMLLGYGVILGVMGVYVLSLWIRLRNAREDEVILQDALEDEG